MKTTPTPWRLAAARLLLLPAAMAAGVASAEEAAGDWAGLLAGQLHIVVHVTKDAAGHYGATLESPDQGRFVLPAEQVIADAAHLSFAVAKIGGSYAGTWNADRKAWVGTWSQGSALPLVLTSVKDPAAAAAALPKRPQEAAIAAGTRPYRQEAVRFTNAKSGIQLAGTLSVPEGAGPFPAVVLIGGSGPGTRDEDVFGHKVFLVLADALNRRGVAVLRYDKRGVGESSGDYAKANLSDFASDAECALAFLAARPEVAPQHVGLVGHSEGGVVAPMIAARSPAARFVVLMAAPGMRIGALLRLQNTRIEKASGVPAEQVAKKAAFFDKLATDLALARNDAQAMAITQADVAGAVADQAIPAASAQTFIAQVTSPWAREAFAYDPLPALRRLQVPVLALAGSLDLQVPPDENLGPLRAALEGHADATFVELPNLNHLFQTAKIGTPAEYGEIEETVAPAALKTIADWVAAHAG